MEGYYTGFVSDVDAESGMVRIVFPQEDNLVSDWLPLLAFEYNPPQTGDFVAAVLGKNRDGVCLGKIFSAEQTPETTGGYAKQLCGGVKITQNENVFRVDFGDAASVSYADGKIIIKAGQIKFDGEVTQ